ncbi:UNKNOWN [Stylonychia lemnae]|uniref:CRAL-TRIO domain-containing protein n=1 Tax=Stylonychia lemnae TaxID=5949 RepID=A0A077ZUV0_STYLE|nr:UNKNOWN [Stylonychia lemnae]|eukprot:CDW73324.1 UNKNOWN [Stylonychia lemnae]
MIITKNNIQTNDSFLNLIPECIKNRLNQIQEVLSAESPELLSYKVTHVESGIRIFQKHQSQNSSSHQKRVQYPPHNYYAQYQVGLTPDYILQQLKDINNYKQWLLFTKKQQILNQIEANSEILTMEAHLNVYQIIPIRTQLRLITTTFIDQKSKDYVLVFKLMQKGCKDLEDLLIFVGLNQIYDKTSMKICVEVTPKQGKFYNQLANNISLEFIKALNNFKTYAKQKYVIEFQLYQFQPFDYEQYKKSQQKQQTDQINESNISIGQQKQRTQYQDWRQQQMSTNKNLNNDSQQQLQQSPAGNSAQKQVKSRQSEFGSLLQIQNQQTFGQQQLTMPTGQRASQFQIQNDPNQGLFEIQDNDDNNNQIFEEIKAPQGYQRENLEYCSSEECKFNGQWSKWCLERCDEEQKKCYYQLRQRIDEAGLQYLSLNHVVRYVKSFNWNVDEAYDRLVQTEKWRVDNQLMEVDPNDIPAELGMRLVNLYGFDFVGRPLIFLRGRQFDPSKMKKNVDQYVMIFDLNNVGYSNFDLKQISKMAPILSVTKAKFKFLGKNYLEELSKVMDIKYIPKEYGGQGPALDDLPLM